MGNKEGSCGSITYIVPLGTNFRFTRYFGPKMTNIEQMGQHIIASLGFSRSINRNGTRLGNKERSCGSITYIVPLGVNFRFTRYWGPKMTNIEQMGQHIIASLGFSRSINRNGTRWEIKRDHVGP